MAERLSGFCEAILNIQGLCKDSLRCCVAKQIFNGNYPEELIIPSGGEIPDLPTPLPQKATTTTKTTTTTTRYDISICKYKKCLEYRNITTSIE